MKKYLPFLFPAVALLLVLFLTYRWYTLRQAPEGQVPEFAEGVQIENLSESEVSSLKGVGDFESLEMESVAEDAVGTVRYEFADGKVRFSVVGSLPELSSGAYQVWLKATAGDAIRKAFSLEMTKGGYMGSAAISESTLPFQVIVSREANESDEQIETILLQGTLEKKSE